MGKIRSILVLATVFFGISNVSAAACDNAKKVEYQEKAKNISYSYKYNDSNNTFDLTFTNVLDGLYLIDMETMQEYHNNGDVAISNVNPGKSYTYSVFTSDQNPCSSSSIYSLYVTLPYYNPYYNDSLCNGISNYKYCKKFMNKQITREEFETNVNNYRKTLEEQNNNDDNNKKSLYDYIMDFYIKYYFIILPIIIITTIIIIVRKNKKDDLF